MTLISCVSRQPSQSHSAVLMHVGEVSRYTRASPPDITVPMTAGNRAQNLEHASRPHCSPRITVCCMIVGDARWERDLAEVSTLS